MRNDCLGLIQVFFCIFFVQSFASAQKIDIYSGALSGMRFYQEEVRLSHKMIKEELKDLPEAHVLFNEASSSMTFGSVLGGIGGALIGWPVGTAIGGGEPKWVLAAAGGGIVLLSIPSYSRGAKKARRAINMYNEANGYTENDYSPILNFCSTENGIGLVLQF